MASGRAGELYYYDCLPLSFDASLAPTSPAHANPSILFVAQSIMATNTRYYYSLPTEAPARSRSCSRRPPLTPSTVSSPCLTTLVPMASRRDSASGTTASPTKASALLAKVVSSPATPRETPAGSPFPSPEMRMQSTPAYPDARPTVSRTESERYVRQHRKQGEQE